MYVQELEGPSGDTAVGNTHIAMVTKMGHTNNPLKSDLPPTDGQVQPCNGDGIAVMRRGDRSEGRRDEV